jgi:hypothetical protein
MGTSEMTDEAALILAPGDQEAFRILTNGM